ncbi:MAG: sugar transferase [Clostridia bacterium]|jgi:lipopolysaccharide/colanic/teichoic acid biosynthesis glycosyltransferase|nr:sugar transferase [Clostridia bacterium]
MSDQSYLLKAKSNKYERNLIYLNCKVYYDFVKRLVDLFICFTALVISAPIIIIACIAVALTSKGSPIFTQERLGLWGKKFKIYKIRSMYIDAEANGRPQLAQVDDHRITPVGKFIRKTRIDELPQLINVIKGDMSIIGPRPEREFFYQEYSKSLPEFYDRLQVKPGITGLAQVSGGYHMPPEEKLKYDMEYIQYRNFIFDVKIAFKTILVMITGKGAI